MENLNKFIFRLGALGIIAIALFAFVPPLVRNATDTSKDIYNLETVCWSPAQFTASQVEFADAVCGDKIRHNETHRILTDPLRESKGNSEEDGENGATINDIITTKPKGECFTFLFLTIELVILFVFYFVTSCMKGNSSSEEDEKITKELLVQGQEVKVRSWSCMQISVYIMMAVCFIFLMVVPHAVTKTVGKETYHSGEFHCSFEVRQDSRVHKYTVQCFYSYEEPSGVNMQRALMLNSALCGLVAVMSVTQALSAFRSRKY